MNKNLLLCILKDPEVLQAMWKDPRTAEFFDEDGNLNVDLEGLYEDGSRRTQK